MKSLMDIEEAQDWLEGHSDADEPDGFPICQEMKAQMWQVLEWVKE